MKLILYCWRVFVDWNFAERTIILNFRNASASNFHLQKLFYRARYLVLSCEMPMQMLYCTSIWYVRPCSVGPFRLAYGNIYQKMARYKLFWTSFLCVRFSICVLSMISCQTVFHSLLIACHCRVRLCLSEKKMSTCSFG